MIILNQYELNKWKKQFPSIVWRCDDCFLGHVIGFADAIKKRAELEKAVKQMAFPTFFGYPARTFVSADGTASFYFEIYLAEDCTETVPIPGKKRAMNGGLIFHPNYIPCDAVDDRDENGKLGEGKCAVCGKDLKRIEEGEAHFELPDYQNGHWSIHT